MNNIILKAICLIMSLVLAVCSLGACSKKGKDAVSSGDSETLENASSDEDSYDEESDEDEDEESEDEDDSEEDDWFEDEESYDDEEFDEDEEDLEEDKYFSKLVNYTDVKENNYNLSVSTYVEKEDTREVVDIKVLNEEIKRIVARENELRLSIDEIIKDIEGDSNE